MDAAADSVDRHALMTEALAGLAARAPPRTLAACAPLLAAHPADTEALLLHGLALALARRPEAAAALTRVAAAQPGFAHPCADLTGLLDAPAYAATLRACLDLTPDDPRLLLLWADNRHAQGDLDAAEAALATLAAANPRDAAAWHRLGLVAAERGAFDTAIANILRAVALDPEPALGWANLGLLLKVQGRFEESLQAYDEALARAPDDPRIHVNRVVALLQAARFAEAWPEHPWRFRLAGAARLPPDRHLPRLAARPALAGRTVLLTHEAGFGDSIQFCRYAPRLAALGARVVLAVPAPLQRLLARLDGVAGLVPADAPLPAYDWHCAMMSLPGVFGTTLETIPADCPYLTADLGLIAAWRTRLPADGVVRVGLVWAGQARPWLPGFATVDGRRSMRPDQLAPLAAVPGARFISLQAYAPGPGPSPAPFPLHDPMRDVTDFADTAAIIANLDLVIGVDTSVIHLAGALGKPVLLLDRYDTCWRWLHGRGDSPWYPTLRIIRQQRHGDWAEVVQRAADELAAFVARRAARAGR